MLVIQVSVLHIHSIKLRYIFLIIDFSFLISSYIMLLFFYSPSGMSNKILSETHHPLSKKFQEGVPIAEWNSIDIGLEIFFREEFEEFRMAILPDVLDQIKFTKTMFQGILVTDIATPDRVKIGIERFAVAQDERGEYDVRLCPLAPYFDGFFDRAGLDEEAKEEFPHEFMITHCGLQNCVRNEHLMLVSDISHLLQNWENFVEIDLRALS